MKRTKLDFLFTLIFTFVMTASMFSIASASSIEITGHTHDEYCEHIDDFENTRILSAADIIADNFSNGITSNINDLAQYSIADEVRNFYLQNQSTEISSSAVCSHPSVTWVNLGSTDKQFGGIYDGYCYKITSFKGSQCNSCNKIVQMTETTSYTYHNFPSGGGNCKNGCGAGLVR